MLCALAALTLSFGCSRDLGNYSYEELPDPAVSGIADSYKVLSHESFSVHPEGDFNDTQEWEWLWMAVCTDDDRSTYTLSTQKDLDMEMTLPEGSYILVFRATDKATGVFWEHQSALQVSATTSVGWMVLCSQGGRTRLDFISDVTERTYCDILHLDGFDGPRKMFWSYYADRNSPFYLISDGGTTRLGKSDFAWEESYLLGYEMGKGSPEGVQSIVDGISGKMMVAGGKAYYSECMVDIGLFSPISDGAQVFAPEVGVNKLTRNIVVPCYLLYDTAGKRFYGYAPALASEDLGRYPALHEMNALVELLGEMDNGGTVTGNAFASFPTGMNYVYMESTIYDPSNSNMGLIYTILGNGSRRVVFGTQLGELWGALSIKDCAYAVGKSLYADISLCEGIDRAEHFAFSPLRSAMYYSIGGKVYFCDLSVQNPSSRLMLDLGAEQVKVLKFQSYENAENLSRRYDLVVASVSGEEGRLRIYEGFESGGEFSKVTPELHTGLGNIVDVSYRELL